MAVKISKNYLSQTLNSRNYERRLKPGSSNNAVILTVRNTTVNKGDVAKAAVQINDSLNCSSIKIIFQYDQTILTNPLVVLSTEIVAQQLGWSLSDQIYSINQIEIVMTGSPLPTGHKTLIELRFDLTPNANIGNIALITIVQSQINKGKIPVQNNNGSITVI